MILSLIDRVVVGPALEAVVAMSVIDKGVVSSASVCHLSISVSHTCTQEHGCHKHYTRCYHDNENCFQNPVGWRGEGERKVVREERFYNDCSIHSGIQYTGMSAYTETGT